MELNMYDGKMTIYKTSDYALELNAFHDDYPLMIGSKDLTYSSAENGIIRNFRIGWDGGLAGGSTYHWSISADGRAKFKTLSADSGTMYNCTISSCKIGSCSLTGDLTGSALKITKNSISNLDGSLTIDFLTTN
jgi:hypothetical protein